MLDIRRTSSVDFIPIIILGLDQRTERIVQGLLPGTEYNVTLKVFRFYLIDCMTTTLARTGTIICFSV